MDKKKVIRTAAAATVWFLTIAATTVAAIVGATAIARGEDAASPYFTRDLSLNDEGMDVYNLQVALNLDSETQVSKKGEGSPGRESGIYGKKTKAAVRRFQEKHGIYPANGRVSGATREAISGLLADAAAGKVATAKAGNGSVFTAGNFQVGQRVVFPGQTMVVEPGEKASVYGYGFGDGIRYDLVIASTSEVFASGVSSTGMTVDYKAPRLKDGRYTLYLADEDGARSNDFEIWLSKAGAPSIATVTPATVAFGEKVTVRGFNFAREGNAVVTASGRIENLPAKRRDGKWEITFTSELGSHVPLFMRDASTSTIPMMLHVETASGGASKPVLIHVEL